MSLHAFYLLTVVVFLAVDEGMFIDELFTVTVDDAENRIFDLIETPIRYYYADSNVEKTDLNLMLGVAIMKGQLMSCNENYSRLNHKGYMNRKYILTKMVNKLYAKFFENEFTTDFKTNRKILDYRLWTSMPKIIRKSRHVKLPEGFDENYIIRDDLYFRNISDKCIRQTVSNCQITLDCYRPELSDEFFGYPLTHQVLYIHILNKLNCPKNENFRKILESIIRDKCSKIYNEARYISNDFNTLKKYKDLFIEQIAICGMQNMIDFVRPEWFEIMSSDIQSDCVPRDGNNSSCNDSHFDGVKLAALGVYWKFLCYKTNKMNETN